MIAVCNIYFTNYYLDGEFIRYGFDVMQNNNVDPMDRIFPKVTLCSFPKHGSFGSIEYINGTCALPVNYINDKIYLYLWFWFFGVCILSALAVIYRIYVFYSPKLRLQLLCPDDLVSLKNDIQYILLHCNIDDWFILHQIRKSSDPITFKLFCYSLTYELDNISCIHDVWNFLCLKYRKRSKRKELKKK